MNRFLVTATLLALLVSAIPADDIFLPDSNPSTGLCNHYPFNPNWANTAGEARYQLVIPSAAMGGKPFSIHKVSFAPCHSVTFFATRFEMQMSHSTLTVPSSTFCLNMPSPLIVIPAGPITYVRTANTWSTLKLVSPFHYNGIDSLAIEMRYQGGTLQGGSQSLDHENSSLTPVYYKIWTIGRGAYHNQISTGMDTHGLKIRLTVPDARIQWQGAPRPGKTVTLGLTATKEGGLPYQVASSFSPGPILIGRRQLGLGIDGLLVATVQGQLPMVFRRYAGILSATGQGSAEIHIPGDAAVIGVKLYSAFLTLKNGEPFNIRSISNTVDFTITF